MTSLTTTWQALADALDDRETITLTGGSTTTAVSTSIATSATGVTSNRYEGRYAFNRTGSNAPQQRKVTAYTPSTGTLTVPTWSAVASTDVVDLTSHFPVNRMAGDAVTDYRTIARRATWRMMMEDEIALAVTTSDVYALTTWQAWLNAPGRIRTDKDGNLLILEPSPVSGRRPIHVPTRGWMLDLDGETPKLRVKRPFVAASGNLTIQVLRPVGSWVSVSATYAESTTGMVSESDEVTPTAEEMLPFLLDEALNVLIARSPGRPNAEWARLQAQARDDIAASRYLDRTQLHANMASREAA